MREEGLAGPHDRGGLHQEVAARADVSRKVGEREDEEVSPLRRPEEGAEARDERVGRDGLGLAGVLGDVHLRQLHEEAGPSARAAGLLEEPADLVRGPGLADLGRPDLDEEAGGVHRERGRGGTGGGRSGPGRPDDDPRGQVGPFRGCREGRDERRSERQRE